MTHIQSMIGAFTANGVGTSVIAGRVSGPRKPTAVSLRKLLGEMFADENDFDGFCLDQFPAVYRRFTNGMDREYRIRLLMENADPIEILASLRRKHASAFAKH